MVFDNPVDKVQAMLDVMDELHIHPEFECFDVGIVRSVGMYLKAGLFGGVPEYNFLMGVASGMPCDADLLALLPRWTAPGAVWQTTLIGRAEIWPVHQKTAELGGMLGTAARLRAALLAFALAFGFAALTDPWVHGALLMAFVVAGLGLFVVLTWLLARLLGPSPSPVAVDDPRRSVLDAEVVPSRSLDSPPGATDLGARAGASR